MTELLSLKEAYKLRKETEEAKALQEAKELLESYYLVAEKLDTHTISRIVDSMNGVEEALGPVLDKLPSLKSGLDSAEAELVALISGKAGNSPKKTSAMMGKAMAFYQHLSSFLRQDLPVLLRSRILAGAKAQPDQPVGAKITPAFKQALDLEKTGGFIKRLFGTTNIPYVDNGSLAQELSSLSYTELINLTKVGATPAVLPQAQIDQAAQQALGQQTPAPAVTPAVTPGAASATTPVTKDKVQNWLTGVLRDLGGNPSMASSYADAFMKTVVATPKT